MEIEFVILHEAALEKRASHIINLSAGERIKLEFGEDELNIVVPENKQWEGLATISIMERNA